MRAIVLSFLFVVVVAAISVEGIDQSRVIGTIKTGDRLLDREWALKKGREDTVQVYNYKYPKFGKGALISCIRVLDKVLNGTNGDLYINSGGVGTTIVDMFIRSKLGFGLQYDIEIWGR